MTRHFIARLWPTLLLPLLVFTAAAAVQKSTSAKKVPVKSTKSSSAKSSSEKSSSVKKKAAPKAAVSSSKSGKSSKKGSKKAVTTASSWRNRQVAPSPERYREIQQALYDKGFLKTQPTGVWDAESADAMKQFQSSRKLSPTGRVNAPSLIDLGLGPKHDMPPAPAVSTPATPGEAK